LSALLALRNATNISSYAANAGNEHN